MSARLPPRVAVALVLAACHAGDPPGAAPPPPSPVDAAPGPRADAGAATPGPVDAAVDLPPPVADGGCARTGATAPGAPAGFVCDATSCADPCTGLVWENPQRATTLTFDEAAAYCASLPGGPWRLPRIQELRGLIRGCATTELGGACGATDPTCLERACMAGCDQCLHPVVNGMRVCTWPAELGGSCDHFTWSGSAYDKSVQAGAWYVDFGNGGWVHGGLADWPALVRCVR